MEALALYSSFTSSFTGERLFSHHVLCIVKQFPRKRISKSKGWFSFHQQEFNVNSNIKLLRSIGVFLLKHFYCNSHLIYFPEKRPVQYDIGYNILQWDCECCCRCAASFQAIFFLCFAAPPPRCKSVPDCAALWSAVLTEHFQCSLVVWDQWWCLFEFYMCDCFRLNRHV